MIDIGLNITNKQFLGKERQVVEKALEKGVEKIILTGTSVNGSIKSSKLIESNEFYKGKLYSTAGIHPHDAKTFKEKDILELEKLIKKDHVLAVGECGLDYNRMFSTKEEQEICFREQLNLALRINKPLFLHERDAQIEFLKIMDDYQRLIDNSVVHCFTGDKEKLKKYIDRGFYIGITGWVTEEKRGKELQEALKYIPLDRLMIETDGPFLLPKNIKPYPKTRVNESKYLPYVNRKISELLNIEESKLAKITKENTLKFFGIK